MIEAIYCVSLSRLVDRRKCVVDTLLPFQKMFDIYIFEAIDWKETTIADFNNEGFYVYDSWKIEGHWNRWWNCELRMGSLCNLLGHYNIWNHISKNYQSALILEDDFVFMKGESHFLESLDISSNFMENNDCDIFYLGCWPVKGDDTKKINENVQKVDYTYNAHAYILTKDSAKELVSSGIRDNMITNDEYITSTYCEHPREDIRNMYSNRKLNAYSLIDQSVNQSVFHTTEDIENSEIETSSFVSTDSYTPRLMSPYYNLFYDDDHLIWILESYLSESNIESINFEVISKGEYLANAFYNKKDFDLEWILRVLIPSDEVSYIVKVDDKVVETGIKERGSLFFDIEYFFSNDMLKM